jgi:hypothetical protein
VFEFTRTVGDGDAFNQPVFNRSGQNRLWAPDYGRREALREEV